MRGWRLWRLAKPIWGRMIRPNESARYTGASHIMFAAVLSVILFPKLVAVCALSFIVIGDTASALVGRRWGKHRFRNKSCEGSAAFFLSSLIPAVIIPEIPIWIGTVGALVATVTEAVSGDIDDNLSVPLVSGLAMHLLIRAFV
jgi:dolichol kinase